MSTIATNRSWTHFRVDRRNPRYCHLTFDHPPINTITATTVAELGDRVSFIEQFPQMRVSVLTACECTRRFRAGLHSPADIIPRRKVCAFTYT